MGLYFGSKHWCNMPCAPGPRRLHFAGRALRRTGVQSDNRVVGASFAQDDVVYVWLVALPLVVDPKYGRSVAAPSGS